MWTFHASLASKNESKNTEIPSIEMKKTKAWKSIQLFQKISVYELWVAITSPRDDLRKTHIHTYKRTHTERKGGVGNQRYPGFPRKQSFEIMQHVHQLSNVEWESK